MIGLLAQSVERRANNANVMSSILIQTIFFCKVISTNTCTTKIEGIFYILFSFFGFVYYPYNNEFTKLNEKNIYIESMHNV